MNDAINASYRFNFKYFFFNDTATTEIYTLSLHDALPIYRRQARRHEHQRGVRRHLPEKHDPGDRRAEGGSRRGARRSEEHTSELQSRQYLVCRLLLEKKKKLSKNGMD